MIDLLSMVSAGSADLEFIDSLEREISAKEIAGRRLYVMLAKHITNISLLEQISDWSYYSLVIPEGVEISFHKIPLFETILLSYHPIDKILSITIKDEPNFLEIRSLVQHILNENKNDL